MGTDASQLGRASGMNGDRRQWKKSIEIVTNESGDVAIGTPVSRLNASGDAAYRHSRVTTQRPRNEPVQEGINREREKKV